MVIFFVAAALISIPPVGVSSVSAASSPKLDRIVIALSDSFSSEVIFPSKLFAVKVPSTVTLPPSVSVNTAASASAPEKLLIIKVVPSAAAVIFHRSATAALFGLRNNPAVEVVGPLMATKPSLPESFFVTGVRIILPPF